MKKFRRILSIVLVVALLAGFGLLPGHAAISKSLEPGDINGDGKVNVGDVSRLYSHIRGVRLITDEDALNRADLTGDGKINIGDTARVYAVVRSTVPNQKKVTLKVWGPSMALEEDGWIIQLANNPNMINGGSISGSAFMDFLYGDVDAYFSGSWDYEYLYEQLGDRLGAVQPPMVEINGQQKQMKSFAGSKAVGVNPQGSNPAVASEFAAFLASVDSQKLRYELDGTIPAATALANDPDISGNMVAMAEINTMRNAAVPQPYLAEMSNYWSPVGNFGRMVACGEINLSNYQEAVDNLMREFGFES